MTWRQWTVILVEMALVCIVFAIGTYFVLQSVSQGGSATVPDQHLPTAITTSIPPSTVIAIVTLPPPLSKVEFPIQAVSYPADWPSDLRYPEQFTVVETSSGILTQGALKGWSAKLRYKGDPKSASDLLSSFFHGKKLANCGTRRTGLGWIRDFA